MKKPFLRTIFSILSFGLSMASADVVLTIGGDVNFNRNRMPVHPQGVISSNRILSWQGLTKDIAPLLTGDLNFANIETVVSSIDTLTNEEKAFAFKSHPQAIQNLIDIGFNFFNLANNHTYDYGHPGMRQTLWEMRELQSRNPHIIYGGLGFQQEVFEPQVFEVNGIRIAFASATIGMTDFKASDKDVGILLIRDSSSYRRLIRNFAKTKADYKILSIHYGTEGQITLNEGQQARYEYALQHGDVDLIIGHHPHVVRPIEKKGNKIIFYSLGNYLMLGSADITKKSDTNLDWGLFARLYLERNPLTGKVELEAMEGIPLTNTHYRAGPMRSAEATLRIQGLNALSHQELQEEAFLFQRQTLAGHGLYCASYLTSMRAKVACSQP